jgi:hypothetical protein
MKTLSRTISKKIRQRYDTYLRHSHPFWLRSIKRARLYGCVFSIQVAGCRIELGPDDDWLGGTFHQHPPECVQQLTMVHGLREPRRSAQLGRS